MKNMLMQKLTKLSIFKNVLEAHLTSKEGLISSTIFEF